MFDIQSKALTIALPKVDVSGFYDEDHQQGVPGGPVEERTDLHQQGEPGAVLHQDVCVGNDHADQADYLHKHGSHSSHLPLSTLSSEEEDQVKICSCMGPFWALRNGGLIQEFFKICLQFDQRSQTAKLGKNLT